MIVSKINHKEYANLVRPFCNFKHGPWVAGGSVRKVYQGLSWQSQDIDFFFADYEQFGVMQDIIKSLGQFDTPFSTDNAVTYTFKKISHNNETIFSLTDLREAANAQDKRLTIQLIRKSYFKSIEDVLDSFDISLAQFATDGTHIFASEQAIEDLNNRTIRNSKLYTQLPNPNRVIKYSAYGFEPEFNLFRETVHSILTHGVSDDSY